MLKSLEPLRHRLALAASMLALMVIACTAVVPAPKAQAVGCHYFGYSNDYGGYSENGAQVNYTAQFYVPSSSSCTSIFLNTMYSTDPNIGWVCSNARVRFYPTSGVSWVTGWQWFCPNRSPMTMATNVINGTKYRMEFQNTPTLYGQLID